MAMFAPFANPPTSNSQPGAPPDLSKVKLVDAVQNNWSYEQIVEVLQSRPDTLNEKGWHGFTALHRAALRGDVAIVTLLLEHNADVNATNDYGETPLMYACKRGQPRNVHLLLEAGADLSLADHQGRQAVHHAASGGSVHTLHYLEQVQGVTFDACDKHGQTPLHITCYQGFQDAVRYLLRKERSDILWKDNYGNLPIHVSSLNALTETSWTLLEMSCCKTLLAKNNEGKTPLDILREGRSIQHQYLRKELSYWAGSKAPHLPPKGPLLSWYSLLFGPFVWFAIIVAIGSHVGRYGGIFMAIGTAVLVSIVSGQQHRLTHISRWANPVQAGAFAAGISHTTICYFYKVLPSLWPHTVNLQLAILLPLAAAMIVLYYRLLTGDPGTCKTSQIEGASGSYLTIEDVAKDRCKMDVFCVTCEIIRPIRTKHCRLCKRCIHQFDHHCLFLINCVGELNHRSFVIFLIITAISHLSFVIHSLLLARTIYPGSGLWDTVTDMFHEQSWVFFLVVMNALSFTWEASLIKYQLQFVSRGLTTAHDISQRNPNYGWMMNVATRDRLRNIKRFFLGEKTLTSLELYQPKTA